MTPNPDAPASAPGGVGNISNGPNPGDWWDPRNWSLGGNKIFHANTASMPRYATNPTYASTPRAQAGLAPANQPQLGKSTSEATPQDEVDADLAWIRAFRDSMNAPLDFDDPYVKNILGNARQTTLTSANNAGIFGPYSQNQAEAAYVKGSAGLQNDKFNRALQAAGMSAGISQNTRDFKYDVAKDKYTNEMDLYKYNQDKASGFGGLVGGGLGAIAGGLVGGPMGASAGFKIGSGIGGNIGGSSGGPPPRFNSGY